MIVVVAAAAIVILIVIIKIQIIIIIYSVLWCGESQIQCISLIQLEARGCLELHHIDIEQCALYVRQADLLVTLESLDYGEGRWLENTREWVKLEE